MHIVHSGDPIQTDMELGAEIERRFQLAQEKRRAEGRNPYTRGSLASLRDLRFDADGLTLTVGQTDYGKFIGSAYPDLAERYGIEQLHLSVAICNFVTTTDDVAVFHIRGEIAYPRHFHEIGGMLPFMMDGVHVHPFDAMIHEDVTELGVRPDEITSMILLGVANDMNPERLNNEIVLTTKIGITARELIDRHATLPAAGRTEGDLILMKHAPETVADFLTRRAEIFVPTGWAGALLYGWHTFGPDWMPTEE